jgi:uncharacterized membrane protein YoaK (UPF0700 family)
MTFVTGLVDAFSYLVLGHVFVANMTGNILFLGFALAGEHGLLVVASVTALVAFFFGAAMGKAHRRNERSSRSIARGLGGGASGLSRGGTGLRGP